MGGGDLHALVLRVEEISLKRRLEGMTSGTFERQSRRTDRQARATSSIPHGDSASQGRPQPHLEVTRSVVERPADEVTRAQHRALEPVRRRGRLGRLLRRIPLVELRRRARGARVSAPHPRPCPGRAEAALSERAVRQPFGSRSGPPRDRKGPPRGWGARALRNGLILRMNSSRRSTPPCPGGGGSLVKRLGGRV